MGGRGKEVFFFILIVLGLVGSNMGKDVKTNNWGWRNGGAGNDIGRTVRDVKEREVLNVVKGRPGSDGDMGKGGGGNGSGL